MNYIESITSATILPPFNRSTRLKVLFVVNERYSAGSHHQQFKTIQDHHRQKIDAICAQANWQLFSALLFFDG